jgi:uncharacterized phage protein (TIGR02216 family)
VKRIAWARLMQVGLGRMGLTPAVFWDLTPAEFMLMAGFGEAGGAMGRDGLDALLARFPDGKAQGSDHV